MTQELVVRHPRAVASGLQDSMPSHYSVGVRALSLLAFAYVAFAFVNGRFLHWFADADGQAPLWLSQWTEYLVILAFGTWRTLVEQNAYTRKRLAFLTLAVGLFWWVIPDLLRLPEPYIGALPRQPIFPQIHAPGTLTFFAILLLVLLFGRRVVCGWSCPCVGIRESVGFAFREKTLRSDTAWRWRHTKWFFFALYMIAFALIIASSAAYVSPFYSGFLALVTATYFGSFFIAPLTGNRFYCRYLCPYGATFGLLNRVGFYEIRLERQACVDCRRCEQVCDMGIPVWQQGKAHGRVTGLEDCMGCGRCVVSCPTDALEFRDVRNVFMPSLKMNASRLLKRRATPPIAPRLDPLNRPALTRRGDWQEVHQPLTLTQAREQASRCLDCGVPGCQNACPLHNRIPEWLEALGAGDIERAAVISHSTSNVPELCGQLCPQHRLCEGGCTLNARGGAVTIGALERFVTEEATRRGWLPMGPVASNGGTAAIIGAGPAGLACADELNKAGVRVTVYDKRQEAGGLLTYGVPSFKLDKSAVKRRRMLLQNTGIHFELGVHVDGGMMRRLVEQNDAVFLGTGAQSPRIADLPGRQLAGIFDGLNYLAELNSSQLSSFAAPPDMGAKRVLILGGGDTAIDCARCAVRQGASSITIAYRRGAGQMRASPNEIAAARAEGVAFIFQKKPLAFVGKEKIEGVTFASDNGWADETLGCQAAIIAFGQEAEKPDWLEALGIATDERGFIKVDKNGRTSHPKVFAGGDNAHGPDLVVTAVAAGRRAGHAMLSTCGL